MPDSSGDRTLLRFLNAIGRHSTVLQETSDPQIRLLRIPGERTLRFPEATRRILIARDLVAEQSGPAGTAIRLTSSGRAARERLQTGSFVAQHQTRTKSASAEINLDESPLAALARLRRPDGAPWLARNELAAGERLRADFEAANLQPRVTASWDPSRIARRQKGTSAELMPHERVVSARRRLNAAVAAVGPELAGALLDICCFLKGLEEVERERAWPRRSAKLMLSTALAMLDRHYHPPAREPDVRQAIRHWGADDYKPEIA
jgi:hypothetical protein